MFSSLRVGERPGEGFGAGGRQKERRETRRKYKGESLKERREVSVERRAKPPLGGLGVAAREEEDKR